MKNWRKWSVFPIMQIDIYIFIFALKNAHTLDASTHGTYSDRNNGKSFMHGYFINFHFPRQSHVADDIPELQRHSITSFLNLDFPPAISIIFQHSKLFAYFIWAWTYNSNWANYRSQTLISLQCNIKAIVLFRLMEI